MEVAIKINGTKEISLNPETPLEQEYTENFLSLYSPVNFTVNSIFVSF